MTELYLDSSPDYPIRVIGTTLTIEEDKMEIGKDYPFNFLGTKMIAFKIDKGLVEVYQNE